MISKDTEGTITTTAAEQSLFTVEQTPGAYVLILDRTNQIAGDTIEVRIKEKVLSTDGSSIEIDKLTYAGVPSPAPGVQIGPYAILLGLDITIKRTAGVDRSYKWSLRRAG